MDLVRVVLRLLDCVKVVEGELEVWRQVVGSHVVIGRAGDDVGVYLVRVDSWRGKDKVLWVGAQYWCVCCQLAGKFSKLAEVEV